MKKKQMGAVLAGALLASQMAMPAAAQDWAAVPAPDQTVHASAVQLVPQSQGNHIKYMNGDGNGLFQPEKPVTRGELAQMLYEIVVDRPADSPIFPDVPRDVWYAPAAEAVAGLGLMTSGDGSFRPGDPATRAECAYALSQLLPNDVPLMDQFPDVWPEYWAYQAICRTAGQGLFLGDSTGNFRPEDGLRRCEAVAVFNRLLGRSPDLQALAGWIGLHTFPDVPRTHWAYAGIMEATVTHQYAAAGNGEAWLSAASAVTSAAGLPDGPQRINGRLYCVSNGEFVRSQSVDGLYFDENGCYTTGNAELDDRLNTIVEELTNDSMTQDEKLQVLFNYCRDNFKYLKRPLISKDQTGWELDYALYFLNNGKGNCYNFSATYCLLCQELGLPAYTVVGSVLNSPHGWVEIALDGTTYLFDPQLAWRYLHDWGKTGYNFFKQPITETTVEYTW